MSCDLLTDVNRVLAGLAPVGRAVEVEDDVLPSALEALLGGPTTPETASGYSSGFSAATAGALASVEVTGTRAIVDLATDPAESLNNVSTSTGGDPPEVQAETPPNSISLR